jgi:hypothetical protein
VHLRGYLVKVTGCAQCHILLSRTCSRSRKAPKQPAWTTKSFKLPLCKQTLGRPIFQKSNITIILCRVVLLLLRPNNNTHNPRGCQSRRVSFMVTRTLRNHFRFRLRTKSSVLIPVSTQWCVQSYLRMVSIIMPLEDQPPLRRTMIFCSHVVSWFPARLRSNSRPRRVGSRLK